MLQRRLNWWRVLIASFAALLFGFAGCEADPMPSPGLNSMKIILSTSSRTRTGGPLDNIGIIGLKSAAPGVGFVVVRSPFAHTEAAATADGTFAGLISGAAGDQLSITYKKTEDGPESEPIQLIVPGETSLTNAGSGSAGGSPSAPATGGSGGSDQSAGADAGSPAPSADGGFANGGADGGSSAGGAADGGMTMTPGPSGPTLSAGAPDAQGLSQITGTGLVPGDSIILGNTRTGDVVDATVASDGTISSEIAAQVGDSIVVVVQDPTTNLTSESATLSVP